MKIGIATLLLSGVLLLTPMTHARDSIDATPFGPVLTDLMAAFHAQSVPCEGVATTEAEVCFESRAVGASYLAERLVEILEAYESIGLTNGGWRSANGVWTVSLKLPNNSFGRLEIYLAETTSSMVKGVVRLVEP